MTQWQSQRASSQDGLAGVKCRFPYLCTAIQTALQARPRISSAKKLQRIGACSLALFFQRLVYHCYRYVRMDFLCDAQFGAGYLVRRSLLANVCTWVPGMPDRGKKPNTSMTMAQSSFDL